MKALKLTLYVLAMLVFIETGLRLFGIKPFPHFKDKKYEEMLQKRYKNFMCNFDSIGIIPCPSQEQTCFLTDKISYKARHLADGSRFCGSSDSTKKILLFTGDSNTHGSGVNDSDHVAFRLQNFLSGFRVINRSIPGSGNISQLLVLRNSLKKYKPVAVIATYGSYHNFRNIFSRQAKKIFRVPESKVNLYRFPCARLRGNMFSISFTKYEYEPMPFSDVLATTETINLLIEKYEYLVNKADDVTRRIWEEYIALCHQNNIRLCVLVLTQDKTTSLLCDFFRRNNVEYIYVGFENKMTYRPFDPHPNRLGHQYLANQLFSKIKTMGWLN